MSNKNQNNIPTVKIEGWEAEKLTEESANKDGDEIVRQMLRGDESKGDADERDVAPALDSREADPANSDDKR